MPSFSLRLFFLLFFPFYALASPTDSIGVEKKGSKLLVLYKVNPGETLSGIARHYGTSVSEIVSESGLDGPKIKAGQIIKVPYNAPKPTISATGGTYTVKAGDNLSLIARSQHVSLSDLKRWNKLSNEKISIGQVLLLSAPKNTPLTQLPKTEKPTENTKPEAAKPEASNPPTEGVHVVKAGENLFKIAQLYKKSVSDLKRWNNLDSDALSVGQELAVEEPKKQIASLEKETQLKNQARLQAEQEMNEARKREAEAKAKKEEKNTVRVDEKAETKAEKNINNYIIKNEGGYEKHVETGLAEVIDDPNSNDMFLALHRTAAVGTIIQIRNLMNDMSVFVKVIGKLPDMGDNDKLIVKLSKRAYERLAALDKRFRVEVSYIPQ